MEKRLPRYNIYLPVKFSSGGDNGSAIEGRGVTINIGPGGALFACRERRIEKGMTLRLDISVESALLRGGRVTVRATVLRLVPLGGGSRGNGADIGVAVAFENTLHSLSSLAQ